MEELPAAAEMAGKALPARILFGDHQIPLRRTQMERSDKGSTCKKFISNVPLKYRYHIFITSLNVCSVIYPHAQTLNSV